jgi:hypothetical protein
LADNFDEINWFSLTGNRGDWATAILEANPDKICPRINNVGRNTSQWALRYMKENFDRIMADSPQTIQHMPITNEERFELRKSLGWDKTFNWNSSYPPLVHIMQEIAKGDLAAVDWNSLSKNPHPWAVALIKSHPDRVVTSELVENPSPDLIGPIKWVVSALMDGENGDEALYGLASNTNPEALELFRRYSEYMGDAIMWQNPAIFSSDPAILQEIRMSFRAMGI